MSTEPRIVSVAELQAAIPAAVALISAEVEWQMRVGRERATEIAVAVAIDDGGALRHALLGVLVGAPGHLGDRVARSLQRLHQDQLAREGASA